MAVSSLAKVEKFVSAENTGLEGRRYVNYYFYMLYYFILLHFYFEAFLLGMLAFDYFYIALHFFIYAWKIQRRYGRIMGG